MTAMMIMLIFEIDTVFIIAYVPIVLILFLGVVMLQYVCLLSWYDEPAPMLSLVAIFVSEIAVDNHYNS